MDWQRLRRIGRKIYELILKQLQGRVSFLLRCRAAAVYIIQSSSFRGWTSEADSLPREGCDRPGPKSIHMALRRGPPIWHITYDLFRGCHR